MSSTPDEHLQLGPFELFAMVGKGGMGEVWRGVHMASRAPVAVKVIAPDRSLEDDFIHAFVQEVHAIAALNHPGIIRVFDHGRMPASTAKHSQGKLVAASPWLAMEFAPRGSLDVAPSPSSWEELRTILLSVLAALAHAHARGIIHRDLKPGNILVGETSQGAPRYMLTDFGLAHAMEKIITRGSYEERASSAGTPHYMPPEQLSGQWRRYGPWTDLYALGCLAYELCCGAPPFDGPSFIHIANHHMNTPAPPLAPRFAVPRGLETWIYALMQKEIGHRPTRAAEAAHMLRSINASHLMEPVHAPQRSLASSSSVFFAPTLSPRELSDLTDIDGPTIMMTQPIEPAAIHTLLDQDVGRHHAPHDPSLTVLPFPESWQPPHDDLHHDTMLASAGLGLFGLREVALIDRIPERHIIWSALKHVSLTHTARGVLIDGPEGCGKSRLCEWMGHRAHEAGVATTLYIEHHEELVADDGLLPSLQRHLRCQDLDRPQTFERLKLLFGAFAHTAQERELAMEEAALLTTLFRPPSTHDAPRDGVPPVHIHGQRERHLAILSALRYITRPRPLILLMDDAHFNKESLELASLLMTQELPILVLVTAPAQTTRTAAFREIAHVAHITLEPLRASGHRAFVTRQLGLTPALASHVARHTRGNPLFAQHVLSDWIARDALLPTLTGFTHTQGNSPHIPDTIARLWRAKLDHLEELESTTWQGPLHIAASLGPHFSQDTWLALCETLETPCSSTLLRALLTRGLLRHASHDPQQLTWGHPTLRVPILRQAHHHVTWRTIHATIAATIAPSRQTLTQRQRYIHHLLHAEAFEPALDEVAITAQQAQDQSDYALATMLISAHQRLCDWLVLPDEDLRRLELIPLQITTHRVRGNLPQALAVADHALPLLHGSTRKSAILRADVLRTITMIHYLQGAYDTSEHAGEEAIRIYETYAHYHGLLKALHTQGWLLIRMGHFERALRMFERGAQIGELHDDLIDRAWCLQAIADLHVQRQRPDDALPPTELAIALFKQGGSRAGLAMTLCTRGDVFMLHDQPDEARHHYTIADEILTTLQINLRFISHGKLAILALRDEELDLAREKVAEILGIQGSNHQLSIRTHLVQCLLAIHDHDLAAVEHHLHHARDILELATYAYNDLQALLARGEILLREQSPSPSLLSTYHTIQLRLIVDQELVSSALSIKPS